MGGGRRGESGADGGARARAALARGDNLRAFDLARVALDDDPDDLRNAHTLVLALARSGATERAEEEYDRCGLGRADAPDDLRADLLALHARLAKDRAFAASGERRRHWAALAADRYATAAAVGDGGYCAVNGATMATLAGDDETAVRLAEAALAATEGTAGDGLQAYWTEVTRAEALLVLGQTDEVVQALQRATELSGSDLSARATTRRQLLVLAEAGRADPGLVDHLPVPAVVAYGGHRLLADDEDAIATAMGEVIGRLDAGVAFGSLASGADTLWAEAALAHGAELHVVLPFDPDEFVATSVRPAGEGWVDRHAAALEAATSVTVTCPGPSGDDDALYAYASSFFLGQAIIRARALTVTPTFLAAWDGAPATGPAGTAADVERWRATGHPVEVVTAGNGASPGAHAPPPATPHAVLAVLFGDFEGFSRLGDAEVAAFVERQLADVGAVLDAAGDDVVFRNSWGDGIYVACTGASTAARLALALQEAAGTDAPLRLRLGGHAGPAMRLYDPVQGRDSWWGQTVVTAARIEPMTPGGEVYVTEPFAALLALQPDSGFTAEYVGPVDTAKGYGVLPMYVLKRRA